MFDNTGMKRGFLDSKDEKTGKVYLSMFHKIEVIETKYNMDITEMEEVRQKECLALFSYRSASHLAVLRTQFRNYFAFLNKDFAFTADQMKDICAYDDAGILSYETIKEIETELNVYENGWYYNAIMFCAFYGFSTLEDYALLRKADIDFENQEMNWNYRTISMVGRPELAKYLRLVLDNDCRYSLSPSTSQYEGMYPDAVFKSSVTKNSTDIRTTMNNSIKRNATRAMQKYTGRKGLTTKVFFDSGCLYYISNRAAEDEIDLKELLNSGYKDYRNLKLKEYLARFGSTLSPESFKYKYKDSI